VSPPKSANSDAPTVAPTVAPTLRDATEGDLPSIVDIYNASIPGRLATADIDPVSVASRRAWFQDRDPARHPLWVAERDGRVVGWLSFGKFHARPAYAATAEVSIYVATNAQRSGIATFLMTTALARAPSLGLTTFVALVFAHNSRSVSLCQKFGFQTWGLLPQVAVLDGIERDLLILGRRIDAD